MPERLVRANGIGQSVIQEGAGPPLILLHGWPQTNYAWRKVVPALSRHYRIIAPDLRGMGRTDKPDGAYDIRTIARDITALMEALDIRDPYIVGHDWGGLAARRISLDNPGLARRILILDVVPHEQVLQGLDAGSALGLWHFFFLAQAQLSSSLVAGREGSFLRHFFHNKCHDPETFIPECLDVYTDAYAAPGVFEASIKYYHALFHENRTVEMDNLNRKMAEPTRVLWGTSGGVGAVLDVLEIWRREAEDVSGRGFDNCGHYMAEEIPDDVIREVLAFDGISG